MTIQRNLLADKIRRKKVVITNEKYDQIKTLAQSAEEILNDERFSFFRDYINDSLKSIETSILENTIKDVKEEVTLSDKLKKIFFTSKKTQIDELSGAYKWAKKMMSDLKVFSEMKDELEDKIVKKEILVSDE